MWHYSWAVELSDLTMLHLFVVNYPEEWRRMLAQSFSHVCDAIEVVVAKLTSWLQLLWISFSFFLHNLYHTKMYLVCFVLRFEWFNLNWTDCPFWQSCLNKKLDDDHDDDSIILKEKFPESKWAIHKYFDCW